MTQHPTVSAALAEAAQHPWFMNSPLGFNPFAPETAAERTVVEIARPIADRAVAHVIREFEGQDRHTTLIGFYCMHSLAFDAADLTLAGSALDRFEGDYETEEPMLEHNAVRAVVMAWVQYAMLEKIRAEKAAA